MKEQFLRNARTAFLRDTAIFYNARNRAMKSPTEMCCYSPTDVSPGCAIGRHVPNKKLCAHFDTFRSNAVGSIVRFCPGQLGPLEVLGIGFLEAVQNLHDSLSPHVENWDASGLTEHGRDRARQICEQFGLDVEKVLAPVEALPASGATNR